MATIFPGSASVGQFFDGYSFNGTAWDIVGIDLTADYQPRVANVSDTELGYLNGVTSAIQTQLDDKSTASKTETLTNKTLTTPTINGPAITNIGQTPTIHGIYLPAPHNIIFEGTTANEFETTLEPGEPTADRTITLPDQTGTVQLRVTDVSDAEIGYLNGVTSAIQTQIDSKLSISSASTTYATKTELNNIDLSSASAAAVAAIVDSAPSTLNTLNELAAALGDDANFASTVTTALGNKLNISTASSTYLTQINASTIYATKTELNNIDAFPSQSGNTGKYLTTDGSTASWGTLDLSLYAPIASPTFTGTVTIPSGASIDGYVTLTGTETLSGKSISDSLYFDHPEASSSANIRQDSTGSFTITTNNVLYLEGANSIVLLDGIPGSSGQYLGSISVNNQIAKIGDLSSYLTQSSASTTYQPIVANVSNTEIGYLDGVTSAIQTQIDSKLAASSASTTYLTQASASTTYQAKVANIDDTEIGYLNNASANIQTQLNSKANLSGATFTGNITAPEISASTKLVANAVGGDEGGEILLGKPATNSTISGTGVTLDLWQNRLRIFEQGGSARGYFLDMTQAAAGVATQIATGIYQVTGYNNNNTLSTLANDPSGVANQSFTMASNFDSPYRYTSHSILTGDTTAGTTKYLSTAGGSASQIASPNAPYFLIRSTNMLEIDISVFQLEDSKNSILAGGRNWKFTGCVFVDESNSATFINSTLTSLGSTGSPDMSGYTVAVSVANGNTLQVYVTQPGSTQNSQWIASVKHVANIN